MSFKRSVRILTLTASIVAGAMLVHPLGLVEQAAGAELPPFMGNVVLLSVIFSDGDSEQGFGFIIGEDDLGTPNQPDVRYYVATANHVVWKNNPDVTVTKIKARFCAYQRESFTAKLLDVADPEFDVAIIEIPKPKFQWEPAAFDENPAVKTDAWFLGLQGDCVESDTIKIIKVSYTDLTLLDNQIQPGTSGAPLISNKGLIGLITRNEPGKATAVKVGVIRQLAENASIPWGLQALTAIVAVQPTSPPTAEPTAIPTAKPAVKPTAAPTAKPTSTPTPKPRPTATPEPTGPEEGDVWTESTTGMKFVWIPGGCFQMGSPDSEDGRANDEGPVHRICLDDFWMGQTEVIQAQWQTIMGDNPAYFNESKVGKDWLNHPVEQVSWNDVQQFISALNKKAGKEIYRLPSEAEWEYACRAGTQPAYSFGNDANLLGQYAWYWGNSNQQTHPVGQKHPNAWALYDMHGNVWEWCADWYDSGYYANSPQDNPQGPINPGSDRVFRGGGWLSIAKYCRAACRRGDTPVYRDGYVGFRLVRTPE